MTCIESVGVTAVLLWGGIGKDCCDTVRHVATLLLQPQNLSQLQG